MPGCIGSPQSRRGRGSVSAPTVAACRWRL